MAAPPLRPFGRAGRALLEAGAAVELHARALRRPPVLVYQMGKVASSAVVGALRAARPRPLVLHVHTLERDRLAEDAALFEAARRRPAAYVTHGRFVRRLLAGVPPRPTTWRIVTLIRDPMARNVSTFFQTLDLHWRELGFADRIRNGEVDEVVGEMVASFLTHFPHRRAVDWFDLEIGRYFDIDPLAARAVEGGWRATGGGGEVLVLRVEDFDDGAERALARFLGAEGIALGRRNVSSAKYYAAAYRAFCERLAAPEALLDELYRSRAVETFYSPIEIEAFRARWSAPEAAGVHR